jgi:hypothetical protein
LTATESLDFVRGTFDARRSALLNQCRHPRTYAVSGPQTASAPMLQAIRSSFANPVFAIYHQAAPNGFALLFYDELAGVACLRNALKHLSHFDL